MIDPTPIPPDTFWKLTGTAWTAISSLVAAASVIVLIVFNWRFLRSAHEQGEAAKVQAGIASLSLKALQSQILNDRELERHAALVVLQETSTQIEFWHGRMQLKTRMKCDQVYLLPDSWNVLVSYVTRRVPLLEGKMRAAALELKKTESLLNDILQSGTWSSNSNSSLHAVTDTLIQRLAQGKATFDSLEKEFKSQDPSPNEIVPCA
jgi:hypothetical protein